MGIMTSQMTLYVVFRGSSSVTNWLFNMDTKLVNFDNCTGCKVHKGFFEIEQSLFSFIFEKLESMPEISRNMSLVFVGHSLGKRGVSISFKQYQD